MSSLASKFAPLFDRVLVQKVAIPQAVKTKCGLILPDTAKNSLNKAVVLAVGPGRRNNDGSFVPCAVKPGNTVIVPEYGGMSIKADSEEFHIFRDEDLIGIYHGD